MYLMSMFVLQILEILDWEKKSKCSLNADITFMTC